MNAKLVRAVQARVLSSGWNCVSARGRFLAPTQQGQRFIAPTYHQALWFQLYQIGPSYLRGEAAE